MHKTHPIATDTIDAVRVKTRTHKKLAHRQPQHSTRTGTSALGLYSRDIEHYPMMSHEEQVAIGESITLHRNAIRQLAMTVQIAVRGNDIPTELLDPFIHLSNAQGFSVAELREAADAIQPMLAYVPVELHATLLDIREELIRPQQSYAALISRLVSGNMRLVLKLVPDYLFEGTTREDLIQDGNLGLIKAAERFDPCVKTTFSTYATHWIEQFMQRTLNTARAISYPPEHLEDHRHVRQAYQALERSLNHAPTESQIAHYLNEQILIKLEQKLGRPATPKERDAKCRWTRDKVKDLLTSSVNSVSLHDRQGDEDNDDHTIMDTVADHNAENPEELYEQKQTLKILNEVLQVLTETERLIVCHILGFNAEPISMNDMTIKFGFTRDKIQRIHRRAIRKLRDAIKDHGFNRHTFSILMSRTPRL
jgi:RNA polymerase nonessential primary-like sigma factor